MYRPFTVICLVLPLSGSESASKAAIGVDEGSPECHDSEDGAGCLFPNSMVGSEARRLACGTDPIPVQAKEKGDFYFSLEAKAPCQSVSLFLGRQFPVLLVWRA